MGYTKIKRRYRGQSILEFVVLMIVIMGALLAMQVYIKRGIQGRWKSAIDGLGDQYDPAFANTALTHRLSGNTETTIYVVPQGQNGFWTMREDTSSITDSREGFSRVEVP